MYFPYLKLRQEEARTIKATVCKYQDNKVLPILEPYNSDETKFYSYKSLMDVVDCLIVMHKKFILIIDHEDNVNDLKTKFTNFDDYCIRGYYNDKPIVLNYQGEYEIAIIHKDASTRVMDKDNIKYHIMMPAVLSFATYLNDYPKNKIVKIENGFVKHTPNSAYPVADIFKSESVFTFRRDGYAGFGDFTILEEGYEVATAAIPKHVTYVIHLTRKQDANSKLEVRHYLTSSTMEPDVKSRAQQTLAKAYNDRHRFIHTEGIQLIINTYPYGSSAAVYKRIGMIHHIELMHSLV